MPANPTLTKKILFPSSYAQQKGSYGVLLLVEGSSGACSRAITEVLKHESCRVVTTLNKAEVKQREKRDSLYVHGRLHFHIL